MKSFLKDDKGSFTIEASLVFPALLVFTLLGVFFCIIIFQIGSANYTAQKAAAQTAYVWNNSNKDLTTGEFGKKYYGGLDKGGDGLYWRLVDNRILQIFGIDGGFPGESLSGKKTGKAENAFKGSVDVDITFNNNIAFSYVEAKAKSALYIPSFVKSILGSDNVEATSTHIVTESPELIRNFNFAKYAWTKSGVGQLLSGAMSSISGFFGGNPAP
ncbi:TadE/TadG family type IV pilus assembly protein [Virgibacillus sp. Bac332]|uniref:TadE/TadG family type IV pilus assembly protein n=1 Tax=Virgibacillus sp. Bac332 TaxID=2419842 RepID=UPI000EF52B12|nr:TadE family protein [Virgibacillus sp. Bac332]